ncbi:AraC family transcriptional regulator [Treponema brennaborense]|uniref:Transcriptional regulator, AraC family n=1 Tax=Treponema brennaborense (strain DSM 12168 / CIP 105900 / DD5/3) TaxID=906968 RepID=F4LPV3_TREBD|nr:AraC family transcriptional regulator [Treponema brennaborense]AEE16045.1 transcriptional regulator, AraC family [Treponema brennaborense DSM 12168]
MKTQDLKESVTHGSVLFPFAAYTWDGSQTLNVRTHWHDETEIVLFCRGTFKISVNMRAQTVSAPAMAFFNAGDIHSIVSPAKTDSSEKALVFDLHMLNFEQYDQTQAAVLTPLTERKLRFPPLITEKDEAWRESAALFTAIFEAAEERAAGSRIRIKARLLELIAGLYEKGALTALSQLPHANAHNVDCVKRILTYIEERYDEKITTADIARIAGMNEQYVCRFFKKATGRTITSYVNLIRIEKAASLLSETDGKIIDIAVSCGYNNVGYFIRTFTRFKGTSPRQYRKKSK